MTTSNLFRPVFNADRHLAPARKFTESSGQDRADCRAALRLGEAIGLWVARRFDIGVVSIKLGFQARRQSPSLRGGLGSWSAAPSSWLAMRDWFRPHVFDALAGFRSDVCKFPHRLKAEQLTSDKTVNLNVNSQSSRITAIVLLFIVEVDCLIAGQPLSLTTMNELHVLI